LAEPTTRKQLAATKERLMGQSISTKSLQSISTKSFECIVDDGLAHIILDRPERGNPIDGEFCHEFSLCIAELSERADVRAVLLSARGRLFSVGGDLKSL
jgi:2-(1,2-epoxy-1,2-dihydrophenyl)acetyl-CoA isomerase